MDPVDGCGPTLAVAPLGDLYRTEWNRVFAVCLGLLRNPQDAEDATQETFARVVARAGVLAGDPRAYLITTARHVCIDELRRRSRWMQADADVELPGGQHQTIEDSAVSRDAVRLAWQRLGDADRRVVAYLFAGLSPAEIGERLGLTAGVVSVRLFRARQRLRGETPRRR